MQRKREGGFSFVEFMMVATVLSFVSTGVKSFVFDRNHPPQQRMASQQVAGQGRASVEQMVRELELAGNTNGSSPLRLALLNSSEAAGPFLLAEPNRVIFEADLQGDGVPERVEYRLMDSAIQRRVVETNTDGSIFTSNYEVVTEYVDNGEVPIFRYGSDPYGEGSDGLARLAKIRTVWITLQLRPPADPDRPQFRTLRFDGLAQHHVSNNTVPVAGLK